MNFKVGDKVRVRKDLVVDKDYGGYDFVSSTEKFKGKIVTIEKVFSNAYFIKEDIKGYKWTDEMLEPVITNWEKVKGELKIEDFNIDSGICTAIHRVRKETRCNISCGDCKKWLKQPYKEPSILNDVEKSYLRAVIKPWRNKVSSVALLEYNKHKVYISIKIKDEAVSICLPNFELGTMYKGMKIDKRYTLEDLDL